MNKENIFIWHNVDEAINKLHNEIQKRDNIINKAIEYIENKTVKVKYKEIGITEKRLCLIHNQVDYLLDILKGSKKD